MTTVKNERTTSDLIRAAVSGWLGTALEFMDFQLYSLGAALVLHEIFFPEQSAAMALILAMGTYGAGYIARIVGAFIFGKMGDRIGRKKVLFITITMMGICTTLIGVLPTYAQVGILAPVLLVTLRIIQGLGAGAEISGAGTMLAEYAPLTKVDSARRCGLYHGRLEKQPAFDPEQFWGEYPLENLTIKTLPGVFSRDGLDIGSQLLLSTLTPHTKGKVLDVGCGAGVLATVLASHSPKVRLSLCDVSAPAVEASRATLAANGIEGEVFASNVFSEVNGRFDMIISNPPFHDGLQTSLEAAQTLIRGAVRHLNSGGELRIVANAFLPYPNVLDEIFGFHEVIAQTGRFKVYRTVMTRQARK